MAAINSNGGNRWNILGFNFTKRDSLFSVYKISMVNIDSRQWMSCNMSRHLPAASGAAAEVPVCDFVHDLCRSVVAIFLLWFSPFLPLL